MSLRTTPLGLGLIKAFEGLGLKAYLCPAGVLTIGWGHTSAAGGMQVTPKLVINRATAESLLRDDIDRFETHVERALGPALATLEPAQFDALVSLAFNIGPGAFARSTLVRKIRAGRLDDVPAQFMRWNKVKGQAVPGLTRRRRAEAALWRGDLEDAERYAGASFGDMPQAVDAPKLPKTMAESSIGNGTIITGAGGAVAAGKAAAVGRDAWQVALDLGPWVILVLLIVAAAAFVWRECRRHLIEDHV